MIPISRLVLAPKMVCNEDLSKGFSLFDRGVRGLLLSNVPGTDARRSLTSTNECSYTQALVLDLTKQSSLDYRTTATSARSEFFAATWDVVVNFVVVIIFAVT